MLGILFLPALLIPIILAFLAILWIVRGSLAGLRRTAAFTAAIGVDGLPDRLPVDDVPKEVEPLVTAVNVAREGIDTTARGRQRFLADAAHERRTSFAFLQTRLEILPASDTDTALLRNVRRLEAIAEQLLYMQRFAVRQNVPRVEPVGLCEQVVADLAPMAIDAGCDIEFAAKARDYTIRGDTTSIERALINPVINAVQHGGGSGCRPRPAASSR